MKKTKYSRKINFSMPCSMSISKGIGVVNADADVVGVPI